MKHQETEDAELIGLAALVAHEAAEMFGAAKQYGELWNPNTPARQTLAALLTLRGVLPGGAS